MKVFWSIIILLLSLSISGQEICNNGIDDDNDGLVDLNDTEDCVCSNIIPSGLIPNPSFEDQLCCPTEKEELDCAVSWIQASEATSDYLHLCGITVHPNVGKSAPMPIPDGEGYIGFRDGHSGDSGYKEYVGACLNETMEVGVEYRLDFFLGFAPEQNQTIDMTIYGSTECSNIPFGGNNASIGCPTNTAGWDILDNQVISGQAGWTNMIFDIIADKPYNVIVIGPGCQPQPSTFNNPYFFVDRLALAELAEFDVPFADIEGSLCQENLTIIAEEGNDYSYQWYRDGIALVGENEIQLDLDVDPANEGFYEVLITTSNGCFTSEEFELFIPTIETFLDLEICEGESAVVDGNELTASGSYTFSFLSSIGCDSTVTVDLNVLPVGTNFVNPVICEGEVYSYSGQTFDQSGFYSISTPAPVGCDSLISIDLTVMTDVETLQTINICEGEQIEEDGDILNTTGVYAYTYSTSIGCDSTVVLDITVNTNYNETTTLTICEGETYQLGDQLLTEAGTYGAILNAITGCDSSVLLQLAIASPTASTLSETICQGETYPIEGNAYNTTGSYEIMSTNAAGCDSIISLELEVIEWIDGILLPQDTTIELGDALAISPAYVAPGLLQIVWTDELGNVLSNDDIMYLDQIIRPTTISVTGVDQYGCIDSDQINVRVDRNVGIYTPNIFSPNGDGTNDYFRPTTNKSVSVLKDMVIYDRWGNLVYSASQITDMDSWNGWNGKMNGIDVGSGVYVYLARFIALDGVEEIVTGDVTILR